MLSSPQARIGAKQLLGDADAMSAALRARAAAGGTGAPTRKELDDARKRAARARRRREEVGVTRAARETTFLGMAKRGDWLGSSSASSSRRFASPRKPTRQEQSTAAAAVGGGVGAPSAVRLANTHSETRAASVGIAARDRREKESCVRRLARAERADGSFRSPTRERGAAGKACRRTAADRCGDPTARVGRAAMTLALL